MKKAQTILGLKYKRLDDGFYAVEVDYDFPQQSKSTLLFYNCLEQSNINESEIKFPIRLIKWVDTINPINKETIMNYYNIKGIKKIVDENKSKLIGKTTFIKPEVQYPKKAKYPNLHVHFYQVSEDKGTLINNINEMIQYCSIKYENTKQFTSKRISDLEIYVNTLEIRQMTFLPMEVVKFDNNGQIIDFQHHLRVLNGIELPF
ncbi:MAG: hypothetical protein EBR38_01990 [Flavobacteriaceae bacterium]|nr:hypothetical protein [Flavobacteriaceae bacterium]